MSRRTLSVAAVLALAALGLPTAAYAVITTLTNPTDSTATPSCPGTAALPCTVVSRTTAIQVEVGDTKGSFKVRKAGRIVGWKVTLSSPTTAQIKYFDSTEGGTARAAIAVIRQVKGLDYRVEYEGPTVHLQPYFGQTVTFALDNSLPVKPGDVIALDVPTWVPALELNAGSKAAWRASRSRTQCTSVAAQTAQSAGSVAEYYCIYRTAIVDFGAIEITEPVATGSTGATGTTGKR